MALLFCDSIDAYATLAEVSSKWPTVGAQWLFNATAGKFGGGALTYGVSVQNTSLVSPNIGLNAANTLNFGFWFKNGAAPSVAPNTTYGVIAIPGGSNGVGLLTIGTAGFFQALKLNASAAILATGSRYVCDSAYHWVEVSVVLSTTSSGSFKVWVDGLLDINYSGITLGTAFTLPGNFSLAPPMNSSSSSGNFLTTFDDVIVWDNTGSFMNTAPLGPRRIAKLDPNGAGASTQLTPSAGNNYACVSQAYSGSANVSDAVGGKTDLYTTAGLVYVPSSTINAVVVNQYSLNPAGDGTKSLAGKLRSGSTPAVATGTSHLLGSTAVTYQDAFYQDATGTAWTPTTVNSAQPGIGD